VKAFLAWIQSSPSDSKPERIRQVVRILFQLDENVSRSPAIRMARLMSAMNEVGYEPHWEIRSGESNVVLHVCPYRDMVGEFPLLCEIDHEAILSASRGHVEVDGLIADGSHQQCVFRVNLPV
jgi:predicted ArsR family transcriptional regulator